MVGDDSRGKPARLAWWPEVRDRSGDKQPLTRSQIVDAAIKLIDAEGLEALSMRRLGQELGAGATSFYWHVKDKDQLIDLVMDEVASELRLDDDPNLPWRERAAYVARSFHAIGKRHRNLAALYGARISMGPNTLHAMDHLLAVLRAGGFEDERLTLAFSSLSNYALGSAVMESRDLTGHGTDGKTFEEAAAMFGQMLASLPVDEYPNLVRLIVEGSPSALDDDGQFEYGLQRMLDGMEAELHASAAGHE